MNREKQVINQKLIQAIKNNDLAGVKVALAQKANPKTIDMETGANALSLAVWNSNIEIVKLLLEKADINGVSNLFKATPIHFALTRGDIKIVDYVVRKFKTETKKLSLTEFGNKAEKILEVLIQGFDEVTKERLLSESEKVGNNNFALFMSVFDVLVNEAMPENLRSSYISLLESLAKTFVNIVEDTSLQTMYQDNLAILQLLIEKGADIKFKDASGISPLQKAIGNKNLEAVKILVENGVEINERDSNGENSIMYALQVGSEYIFNYLLEKGADLTFINNSGWSVVHLAAVTDSVKVMETLLTNKNLNMIALDNQENTPLHYAAIASNDPKILELLVKTTPGAVNMINKGGATPLHSALANLEKVKILFENGAKANIGELAKIAVSNSYNDSLTYLVQEHNLNVDAQDKEGRTLLEHAIKVNNIEAASLLIEKNAKITDHIFGLAKLGFVETIIKAGIDLNAKNSLGETMLHQAIKQGNNYNIIKLVEAKADLNMSDNNGRTALHLAYLYHREDIANYLIENCANIWLADNNGKLPYYITDHMGHEMTPNMIHIYNRCSEQKLIGEAAEIE